MWGSHCSGVRAPHPHRPPHQQRVFPHGRSSGNSCSMKNFGKVLDSKRLTSGYNHVPGLCTVVTHLIPIHHASASPASCFLSLEGPHLHLSHSFSSFQCQARTLLGLCQPSASGFWVPLLCSHTPALPPVLASITRDLKFPVSH